MKRQYEESIHILHFTTKLGTGGVQSFLVNYAKHMDPERVVFDFAVQTDEEQRYDAEMRALGGRIFPIHSMTDSLTKYFCDVYHLCKNHPEILAAHSHLNYRNVVPLLAARLAGVPIRISHSHTAYEAASKAKAVARKIYQAFLHAFATEAWGCSEKANLWLYGECCKNAKVIHNAISVEQYRFQDEIRVGIRRKLGIQNQDIVWVHVGTFGEAKNHKFLLELFADYLKKMGTAQLLLCGDGTLRTQIEKQIKDLNLEKNVILLGMTDQVPVLLMAADVFVLPSLYEGLSLSTVEAQASGLPCVVSNAVPQEAVFMENVCVCNRFDTRIWCDAIEKMRSVHLDRGIGADRARQAGYDINTEAQKLQNLYISLVRGNCI